MSEAPKLSLYNSLSGNKEVFESVIPGRVGMYVCGPTVYNNVHLGNVRTFISFDIVYRYLAYLGYKVRYVRNITDAGHLENDADVGEDRISKKARLEQIEPMEVVQRYTVDFHNVLDKFNCLPPSIEPTATGHIVEQIQLIQEMLERGFAYKANGSVYFDVLKFNKTYRYGKLSNRNIEDLIHNTRELDGQSDKKNPQDFALWKKAEPQHIMRWTSPWSDGFPGWHLECTAMSEKYLGKQFDIHGGGIDLKFPHHECEIAQSESRNGLMPVKYWMHANMLTLNGKKMAKSTGNSILPNDIFSGQNDILEKPFAPEVVRFFILQAHYRSILDFSNAALLASEKGYFKLMEGIRALDNLPTSTTGSSFDVNSWKALCIEAMNDDFNTPILIAHIFDAVKAINLIKDNKKTISSEDLEYFRSTIHAFVFDVLGLKDAGSSQNNNEKLTEVLNLIVFLRKQARDNKDYETSDRIRETLEKMGITIKDTHEGTVFSID